MCRCFCFWKKNEKTPGFSELDSLLSLTVTSDFSEHWLSLKCPLRDKYNQPTSGEDGQGGRGGGGEGAGGQLNQCEEFKESFLLINTTLGHQECLRSSCFAPKISHHPEEERLGGEGEWAEGRATGCMKHSEGGCVRTKFHYSQLCGWAYTLPALLEYIF